MWHSKGAWRGPKPAYRRCQRDRTSFDTEGRPGCWVYKKYGFVSNITHPNIISRPDMQRRRRGCRPPPRTAALGSAVAWLHWERASLVFSGSGRAGVRAEEAEGAKRPRIYRVISRGVGSHLV